MEYKICKHCNQNKPFNELHSTTVKGKIHYRPCCRQCWNQLRRERRKNPLNNPRKSGVKECKLCKDTKPISEFNFHKATNSINSHCKPCHQIKWHERWNKMSVEHRRELRRSSSLKYRASEKGRKTASLISFNRHKRHKEAPIVELIKRETVLIRDNYTCYLCLQRPPLNKITLDHVIPLARGGNHTYDNVKVACRSCNSKKHTKLLSELNLDDFLSP